MNKRKFLPVAIALVAVIAVSGVAYAYWTAGGSGTGTGTAAGGVSNLVINRTSTINPMYPGDGAQAISGNFTNTNSGPVYVSTVTVSFDPVTPVTGNPGPCDATDFTLANPTATVNLQVPVGSPEVTVTWSGPTIQFNNKPLVNQDGCKGATVHLVYSIP